MENWNDNFRRVKGRANGDFESHDGALLLEVKQNLNSVHGFLASVTQMALWLLENPGIRLGVLVLQVSGVSLGRLQKDYHKMAAILQAPIAQRIALIVIHDAKMQAWIEPETTELRTIERLYRSTFAETGLRATHQTTGVFRYNKNYFEAAKVLLARWALQQGTTPIGQLAREVGCSLPTIRNAIGELDREGWIRRTTNRSVEIIEFSRELRTHLMTLRKEFQPTFRFRDVTGSPPDYAMLIDRLPRFRGPDLAVSGVVAARSWYPQFDLNGIPQLHLVVHTTSKQMDLSFMSRWDPALQLAPSRVEHSHVTIRGLTRYESLFQAQAGQIAIADPIETWLDLADGGLQREADEMLSFLRQGRDNP